MATWCFIAGIGAHFEGDIKAHTKHVLDEIQKRLEEAGSSMEKVLKVNVYLNDLKDYAGMNEMFLGRFGPEPPVRTTIAAAGGIPGNSLVEIDCIAVRVAESSQAASRRSPRGKCATSFFFGNGSRAQDPLLISPVMRFARGRKAYVTCRHEYSALTASHAVG